MNANEKCFFTNDEREALKLAKKYNLCAYNFKGYLAEIPKYLPFWYVVCDHDTYNRFRESL